MRSNRRQQSRKSRRRRHHPPKHASIRVRSPTSKEIVFSALKSARGRLFSSPASSTGDRAGYTINSIIASPTKAPGSNPNVNLLAQRARGTPANVISPVSNILNSNGERSLENDVNQATARRKHKRRSVSAATASATTYLSIADRNSRAARTNSSSAISVRSKSSNTLTSNKRSHSPSSVNLLGPNKNVTQRKKQKVSHHWALFGKSEQKLVTIDVSSKRIRLFNFPRSSG